MKKIMVAVIFSAAFIGTVHAQAQIGATRDLFSRGRTRASLSAAMGSSNGESYFVMGGGVGYYIANGLQLGVDGEAWLGNDPDIYKVTPEIRYVFTRIERLYPYVGAFYRRTFFSGKLDDLDSYGGRAGIYSSLGGRMYAGVGMVYEKYAKCDDRIYSACVATYPEFVIGAAF